MKKLLITTAALALLAGPALAGGNHNPPSPPTPPTPPASSGSSSSANAGASAGAAALGVGVGIGQGGDSKSTSNATGGTALAGVLGSGNSDVDLRDVGNSSSTSGVFGSGNSTVKTSTTSVQGQIGINKIGDVGSSSSAQTGDSTSSATVGDLSTGASTSSASADGSNNASQTVDARTFNPEQPVATAVGSVTFQPQCSKGMAAGFQGRDFGVSLGGGKDQEWCVISNLAASMHGFGETQAAVRIMCLEPRVRKANPTLCARPEDYKPQVVTQVEYRDRVVYRDAPVMAPIPNPPAPAKPRRHAAPKPSTSLDDYCAQAAKVCKAIN